MKNKAILHRQRVSTLPLLLLLLQSCQPATTPQKLEEVRVVRVLSGQTLEVTGTNGTMRVRLVGIDAPDMRQQPWGRAAKDQLEAMIGGKAVLLQFDMQDRDQLGRRLAYVWQNGELLNEKLLAQGYVLAVARDPNHKYDQRFSRAQEWARLMGQGIWNPDKPMRLTPTEFRSHNR